jgi:hypothetical protein
MVKNMDSDVRILHPGSTKTRLSLKVQNNVAEFSIYLAAILPSSGSCVTMCSPRSGSNPGSKDLS